MDAILISRVSVGPIVPGGKVQNKAKNLHAGHPNSIWKVETKSGTNFKAEGRSEEISGIVIRFTDDLRIRIRGQKACKVKKEKLRGTHGLCLKRTAGIG